MKSLLLLLLRVYKRFLSPLLPRACRFEPTCSVYMMQAVEGYGALRGLGMGLRRLSRCHPFHEGGYDPVPNLGASTGPLQGEATGSHLTPDPSATDHGAAENSLRAAQ